MGELFMIYLDMEQDLNNWAYKNLKAAGFKNVEPDNALYQHCNILLRKLQPKPRQIEKSKDFTCPIGYEDKLKFFEEAVISGKDLTHFMSRSIQDAISQDKMLFDWGLYHFHLSNTLDKNNSYFIKGSKNLLVAYVDPDFDDTIYFLQIRPHKSILWTEQELIRCLADNWPNLTEKYRLSEVASLTSNITDNDYKNLRGKNANTMIDLQDGRVYLGFNWGITSNGFSVKALTIYDRLINDAMIIQENIIEYADVLLEIIGEKVGTPIEDIYIELVKPNLSDYIFKVKNITNLFIRIVLINENRTLRFLVGDSIEQLKNEENNNNTVP